MQSYTNILPANTAIKKILFIVNEKALPVFLEGLS